MFDSELDHAPYEPPHTEITLSNATLLLIFFGAVLVCGMFFGFGYSMGRKSSPAATAPAGDTAQGGSTVAAAPSAAATHPAAKHAEDKLGTATVAATSAKRPAAPVGESKPKSSVVTGVFSPVQDPKVKSSPASATKTVFTDAAVPSSPSASTAAPGGKTYQVQVAAVTRQDDADALAGALRKKGYTVVTKLGADKLIRVQMGPYASQKEAAEQRDKLVSDGYMAIVK